jgi:hypothetical protein
MKREVLLLLVSVLVSVALGSVPENATNQAQALATQTADYQDSAWLANMQRISYLLANDFESISAVSRGDLTQLTVFGRYLIYDTQRGIYENDHYKVSPNYQVAQKEWRLALQDYNLAGKLMIEAGNDAQNNTDVTASVKLYTNYLNSGNKHANRSNALIKVI